MNSILKILPAILEDTLTDSLKMLPFLFVAYLFIEYLEHRHSAAMEKVLSGGGKYGFFSGALLGIVPQCGFSAMAANLYSSNVITAGTLISVFLATSDEAVPLLVAEPSFWPQMLLLLVLKFFFAVIGGFLVDNVLKKVLPPPICGGYEGRMEEIDCHEHREKEGIFKAAVRHTLHIFIFIVIFIFLLLYYKHSCVSADTPVFLQ